MPIPVIIITGFLGCGKTTLLRRLLPLCGEAGVRPALIINEVGDADIDGELLADLYAEQVRLVGGCVCCTLQSRLTESVAEIVARGGYDLILLECSGLSNPLDVLTALSAPTLLTAVGVSHVVCVVDAARAAAMLQVAELAKSQAAAADLLVMNKRDKLAPEKAEDALALIRAHTPHADVHWTTYGDLDAGLCRRMLADPAPTHTACACGHDHHDHAHHALPASFYTVALPLPELPDRAGAERLLRALPAAVIRAKGFVHLADGGWHVLHRVFDAADVIPYDAVPSTGALLVCIGQHLDAEAIRATVIAHLPAHTG